MISVEVSAALAHCAALCLLREINLSIYENMYALPLLILVMMSLDAHYGILKDNPDLLSARRLC